MKEKESQRWKKGRIVKTFKKTGKYKHWRHIDVDDEGRLEIDFENNVEEWKEGNVDDDIEHGDDEAQDTFFSDDRIDFDDIDDVFPVKLIPRSDYHRPDVQQAMKAEIIKFKNFKAFEEVIDEGQKGIPIRWVVTEQKHDGKDQPIKARLCMRGDLEKDNDAK